VHRPDLRLTVDTTEDLTFMQSVLGQVTHTPGPAPLVRIIAAADRVLARQAA
jgi:spore coat polysaccharide biosynthesis protein SpsF (cytidylyltransferase family)